ncbi:MAG: DUF2808 domain-containing protein [Cyanobacteria bacterium P01_A01_bin.123]
MANPRSQFDSPHYPAFGLARLLPPSCALLLGLGALISALPSTVSPLPAVAVELLDGSNAFAQLPRLLSATTSRDRASARNAVYTFNIALPADAGEALGSLTVAQRNPRSAQLRYQLDASQAYGKLSDGTTVELPLASINQDPETEAITFAFAQPVSPGQEIILNLYPRRNPRWGGTYLFGITATPAAAQPQSQFLGYGQIRIYEPDNDPFLRQL